MHVSHAIPYLGFIYMEKKILPFYNLSLEYLIAK